MAVPAHRLKALTQELPMLSESINAASALQYQPITTVYLQYAPTVSLPRPMTGLLGGYGQWVFDRGPLTHQAGLLAVVISAEGPHGAFSQGELAAKIQAELQATFPHLGKPEWTKVITEKRATFACTPNLNRPSQRTALERCYLAGDYTAGEYPSTIEGAVQSGVKCAQLILNDLKETQT
jgi:predicted NAD/FAD-binding protein